MATWTVDRGLDKLLAQINAAAPNRSKASDGSIGDAAHSARDSDHNPEIPAPAGNPTAQVDARDYTHDPAHGADMAVVSEAIRKSQDRRVKYVIFNHRIYSGPDGPLPWVWRAYSGINSHEHHMHVSVRDSTHDQTQDWQIGIGGTVTDVTLAEVHADQLAAVDMRMRALTTGNAGPYDVKWTTSTTDTETMWAVKQLALVAPLFAAVKAMAADVAAIKVALAAGTPIPGESGALTPGQQRASLLAAAAALPED